MILKPFCGFLYDPKPNVHCYVTSAPIDTYLYLRITLTLHAFTDICFLLVEQNIVLLHFTPLPLFSKSGFVLVLLREDIFYSNFFLQMTLPILNMTAFSDVRISTKRGDEGKIMNDESSIYSFTKLATVEGVC